MTEEDICGRFLTYSSVKLGQLSHNVSSCLALLSDEQVWESIGKPETSVANLVLHLCGNVGEWIIANIGGEQDMAPRNEELAARGGLNGKRLSGQLSTAVMRAMTILDTVSSDRLTERLTIRNYDLSVFEAIYHVVEDFSMHAGQIMLITRLLTGKAPEFEHDLQGFARCARGVVRSNRPTNP